MASLIKNQIIKHLSTFARNLKPEQISLEVLRGKGQLRNLELNEEVISERLEFPPWLRIVKAHCSSVTVKIPWTQIKSAPVQLFVEEIRVVIRLVQPSSHNIAKKAGSSNNNKAYDLPERVLECLSLYVQSIEIFFETESGSLLNFGGSIMLSHLVLESRTPTWQEWPSGQVPKINMTRIHERSLGQVLFFKHVSWRVLKIEASHNNNSNNLNENGEQPARRGSALNSPLRLLTENGRCRITIKKNTSDCSLIAGRMELFFDEIHWLAYMAHLRSAIDFYQHIMDLANSSSMNNKQLNVQQFLDHQKNPFTSPGTSSSSSTHPTSNINAFRQLDINQSSHHLFILRIDLHLCDDSTIRDLPSDWNIDSGAMQATIHKLRVDFYPQHQVFESTGKHLNCSSRSSWLRYIAPNSFTDLVNRQLDHHFGLINSKMDSNTRLRFERVWPQLISVNVVIRIEDLIIQAISERNTKKDDIRYLLSVNKLLKDRMPQPLSFAHLEITSYSFPATDNYPVPPNSVHLMLAPFELIPDIKSIRWLIYAFENILNSFEAPQSSKSDHSKQVEIKIEMIMPKIQLNSKYLSMSTSKDFTSTISNSNTEEDVRTTKSFNNNKEVKSINKNCLFFPKRFFINLTTIIFSNYTLISDTNINNQLKFPQILKFKAQKDSTSNFIKFAENLCCTTNELKNTTDEYLMLQTILKRIAELETNKNLICDNNNNDEWYFSIPTLWIDCDFGPNTWELPLTKDVNLFGSICSVNDAEGQKRGNCVLIEPCSTIDLTLDHFQYVRIEQLGDCITDLIDQLNSDHQFFSKHHQFDNLEQNNFPISIYLHCNKINLHLILPPGLSPSPYDINYSYDLFKPFEVYLSSSDTSSHAINDERSNSPTAQHNKLLYPQMPSKSNSLTNVNSSLLLNEKQLNYQQTPPKLSLSQHQQYPNSARSSLTTTTTTEKSGKGNFKTVSSLPRVTDILNEGKPNEHQSSKKQKIMALIGQTSSNSPSSDFYGGMSIADLESNFDDTFSITSISTEQIAFDSALINDRESEISGEDIAEAEEAIEDEPDQEILHSNDIRILRHKERLLAKEVNVCDLIIEDLNFYANSNNGNTKAFGFATSVQFDQRLQAVCGKIYNEKEVPIEISPSLNKAEESENNFINPIDKAKLKIELISLEDQQSTIKLNINDVNINLNKEVISQLGPFFENEENMDKDNSKSTIELTLQNCNIEIKDSVKRFPIKIRLGEVNVEKGSPFTE